MPSATTPRELCKRKTQYNEEPKRSKKVYKASNRKWQKTVPLKILLLLEKLTFCKKSQCYMKT